MPDTTSHITHLLERSEELCTLRFEQLDKAALDHEWLQGSKAMRAQHYALLTRMLASLQFVALT